MKLTHFPECFIAFPSPLAAVHFPAVVTTVSTGISPGMSAAFATTFGCSPAFYFSYPDHCAFKCTCCPPNRGCLTFQMHQTIPAPMISCFRVLRPLPHFRRRFHMHQFQQLHAQMLASYQLGQSREPMHNKPHLLAPCVIPHVQPRAFVHDCRFSASWNACYTGISIAAC